MGNLDSANIVLGTSLAIQPFNGDSGEKNANG